MRKIKVSLSMPNIIRVGDLSDFDSWIKTLKSPPANIMYLDDLKRNHKVAEILEVNDYQIYHFEGEQHTGFYLHTVSRSNKQSTIDYIVKYTTCFALSYTKYKALMQSKVWRNDFGPPAEEVLRPIFFEELLPKFGRMATDWDQTDAGMRMWKNLVADALRRGLHVYWFNMEDADSIKITNIINKQELIDLSDLIWGTGDYYRMQIVVISVNPIVDSTIQMVSL